MKPAQRKIVTGVMEIGTEVMIQQAEHIGHVGIAVVIERQQGLSL